jgi:lipopolysaccharide export system permease protein
VIGRILDRYLVKEWSRILIFTGLGFPVIAVIFEITDNLDRYLPRGLGAGDILLAHLFSLPDKLFMALPAAVLFATLFSIGSMDRHSELAAAKASGMSFHRLALPVFAAALLVSGVTLVVGELAPAATRRQLEMLGELEVRSRDQRSHNFVYRAEEGWTYAVRELRLRERTMHDVVLEREGTDEGYPTLAVQAQQAQWNDTVGQWTLEEGRLRVIPGTAPDLAFAFDSMRLASVGEGPEDLMAEPKRPQEMRYAELGRYIDALERSGGDGRQLRVEQALKIAVPFTCFIIAIFGAPLVTAAPRAGGAIGVALGLGTTIVFLTLVQLSRAIGSGGIIPPTLAAWLPNLAFGAAGLWMLRRAPT